MIFPLGLALNSKQQLVVAEWVEKKVVVFDRDGKKVQTISHKKFSGPTGVAVDKMTISMCLTMVYRQFLSSARKESL